MLGARFLWKLRFCVITPQTTLQINQRSLIVSAHNRENVCVWDEQRQRWSLGGEEGRSSACWISSQWSPGTAVCLILGCINLSLPWAWFGCINHTEFFILFDMVRAQAKLPIALGQWFSTFLASRCPLSDSRHPSITIGSLVAPHFKPEFIYYSPDLFAERLGSIGREVGRQWEPEPALIGFSPHTSLISSHFLRQPSKNLAAPWLRITALGAVPTCSEIALPWRTNIPTRPHRQRVEETK